MAIKARVNEEALLKALDALENGEEEKPLKKGSLPKNTKEADGGLTGKGGEGPDAAMEVEADEKDPTKGSKKSTRAADEEDEEDVVEKADDSDSDEEEDETKKGEEDDEDEEETSKSLREIMEEDDTVSKAIEVSDFLEHFVDQTSEAVDGLSKSIRASTTEQQAFNSSMKKAIVAMGNLLSELNSKIENYGDDAPVAQPRSVMSKALTAGAIEDRTFAGNNAPEFSRDQALDALISLATNGKIHPAVVTQYETTGSLPREVQSAVDTYLRQN